MFYHGFKFYNIYPLFRITHILSGHIAYRILPEDYDFGGELHNFWEVVYVADGKLEVTEDENVYLLGPHDIIFHAPNEFHRLSSAEGTTPHVLNISFAVEGDLPQAIKNGVFNLSSTLHQDYLELINEIIGFDEAQTSGIDYHITAFELTCRYSAFIMQLLRHSQATKDRISHSAGARTYRTIVEMMQKEVMSNLSLEDISDRIFVSVSYIKKLFARYAGISPKSYYTNLRIAEAKRLLNTDIPISEISEMMNFSSPSYFVTFFKGNTGYTPTQYRKT